MKKGCLEKLIKIKSFKDKKSSILADFFFYHAKFIRFRCIIPS